ncbi:MAG: hypothetical protein NTY35_07310 [Planctomycetota bacterium]|nr:hypothetical protein [Planctomycetota bacterium]
MNPGGASLYLLARTGLLLVVGLAAFLPGCRSAADDRVPELPVRIEVGRGSPDAIARRAATEFADAEVLAALGPRAGERDRRFLVRLERAGRDTDAAFETLFGNALVGTGRFLVVEDPRAPAVRAQVSGPRGDEEALMRVRGPDGEVWLEARGHLDGN